MSFRPNWYCGVALRTLGEHMRGTDDPFTAAALEILVPEFSDATGYARAAVRELRRHGLITPVGCVGTIRETELRGVRWHLTADGFALARAVAQAHPSATPPEAALLATRLWALLRIRRVLTSEQAAGVLHDAGDSASVTRMQRRIAVLLRGWARTVPHAVRLRARREARCKCYVLVQDLGGRPPPTEGPALPVLPALPGVPARFTHPARPAAEGAQ